MTTKHKNDSVAPIRALVSLGIVLRHFFFAPAFQAQFPTWVGQLIAWLPASECFLVLSGFFLAQMFRPGERQYLSLPEFIKRRMLRLLVPYWVVFAIGSAGLFFRSGLGERPDERLTLIGLIANFLCVSDLFQTPQTILFFWTIHTLIQFSALYATVFWLIRRGFLQQGSARYHIGTEKVLCRLVLVIFPLSVVVAWSGLTAPPSWLLGTVLPYLLLGKIAYWSATGHLSRWVLPLTAITLGIAAAYCETPKPLSAAATAVILVIGANRRVMPESFALRRLNSLGDMSYSLYLVHGLVGVRLWLVLGWLGLQIRSTANAIGWIGLAVAASVLAARLLYVLIERPLASRSRRVEYRR